jgi:CDP-diacylglycerol--glycerol-3-phosphate 3-phosphatidyltransferase
MGLRITANQVTIARICAMPFMGFAIYGDVRTRVIGVIIGTLVGLTDFVDGYLARKYGSTVLGSLLDPVADKVFIVVCYACYADRGGIRWWLAAAILSRELLVTVLRSSLELRGRRLPSTIVAKAKTWVQMIGFGLLALVHILGAGRGLTLLFAVPLGVALSVMAVGRLAAPKLIRPFAFAAAVLAGFLLASAWGPRAVEVVLLGFVIFITWYSALDYLSAGARELVPPGPYRGLHAVRLVAGAAMPVVALAAIATNGLPTIPIILLLSSDMARGALDNYAAHRGVVDFSWAASLWAEIGILGVAILYPAAGTVLTMIAAAIAVTEMLRSFARYLRRPAAAPAPKPAIAPAAAGAPVEP